MLKLMKIIILFKIKNNDNIIENNNQNQNVDIVNGKENEEKENINNDNINKENIMIII